MKRTLFLMTGCIGILIGLICVETQADIFQFGFGGTVPVIQDFDGDGLPDFALFHDSSGTWYIQQSTDGLRTVQWGFAGTVPAVADYDRDGKADIGVYNQADGMWYLDATRSTIGNHTDRGTSSYIGSGENNTASGNSSFIGSGQNNRTLGLASFVGCGVLNLAYGDGATIMGGMANMATGTYAAIPGGTLNKAYGDNSFAAGKFAEAMHHGSFVWGDNSSYAIRSTAPNQFTVRARGGTRFISATIGSTVTAGVHLSPGGNSWGATSDRNMKENFETINKRDVLEKLSQIAVTTWNMKSQDPSITHIGPMAQDFYATFGVGEDEHYITTSDADGVALAAIQGLYEIVQEKDNEIQELKARLAAIEAMLSN